MYVCGRYYIPAWQPIGVPYLFSFIHAYVLYIQCHTYVLAYVCTYYMEIHTVHMHVSVITYNIGRYMNMWVCVPLQFVDSSWSVCVPPYPCTLYCLFFMFSLAGKVVLTGVELQDLLSKQKVRHTLYSIHYVPTYNATWLHVCTVRMCICVYIMFANVCKLKVQYLQTVEPL